MRVLAGLFAISLLGGIQESPRTLAPIGRIAPPAIDESSGLVASRRYPGIFWTQNDSGDTARFFPMRLDGTSPAPDGILVDGAKNVDWEDIALAGRSLYLCDVGNNGNRRQDLTVYVVDEPNPVGTKSVKPRAVLPVRYPDQEAFPPAGAWPFDCEAVFTLRGKLYFITKHRVGSSGIPDVSGNLYRLDTRHTNKPNVLTKLDSKADFGGWVTGADVSPDGRTLAVLIQAPQQAVWLFSTRARGDRFFSAGGRKIALAGLRQAEAIAFQSNSELILTNEQRDLFRISLTN